MCVIRGSRAQDYVASLRFPFPSHGLSYKPKKKYALLRSALFSCTDAPYESGLSTGRRYTKKALNVR